MPEPAVWAHFLTRRRALIPGLYRPMWYMGERVVIQHSFASHLVPFDPLESMMLSVSAIGKFYVTVLDEGDADSLCLPWEGFVVMRANYRAFLDRLATPVRFLRYTGDNGEPVEVPVPGVPSLDWVAAKAIPEQFIAPSRSKVRRWMVVIDSLKKHCVKLTKKLVGHGRTEHREAQRGPEETYLNLSLSLSPADMGDSRRHSDVGDQRDTTSTSHQNG
ncbi:hypothetical protein SOVF_125050 [Spinacia oleracea]|nr:hypothetical protein SOVF_125050 [Spinacia oleracea]